MTSRGLPLWLVVAALACGSEPGADVEGSGGSSGASDTDAPSVVGTCPAPDPSLAPVPIAQAASTQAAYACMAWVGCACDVRGHDPVPSCRHGLAMTYERLQEEALELGLVYDGLCLAQHVADLEAIGCMPAPVDGMYSVVGSGHCGVYHGTLALGDTCTSLDGGLSDCAQGLACWSEHCIDPCLSATPGERCHDPFDFACAPGMVCESDDCVVAPPPAPIGASCEGGCADDAWCSEACEEETCVYTCVARAPDGSPCTEDRHCSSRFCSEGACAVGPVTGEACVADRCLTGRECEAGVCGAPEGAICGGLSE